MHGGGRGGGTDRGRGGFRGGGRGAGRGGSALGGRDSRDEFRLGRAAQKVEIPVGLKPLGLPGGGIDGRWFEATGGEGGAEESRKRKKKGGGGSAAEGGDAESLRAEASKRLEQDVALADQKSGGRGGSNAEFLKKVVSSGTLTDKMASMMLMVQEAPMHRLRVLDALVKMAERKGKREQVLALETLKDLFVNALLPPRKLRYFHDLTAAHGGAAAPERSRVLWFFEDALKRRFAAFVAALESATHDPLVHVRSKAIRMAFDLLRTVPEQEAAMLFMLVNKLGDPDKKVASSAMHLLNRLLQEHPAMKGVVAAEVQRIMFRPNVSDKAKHYATAFLAQVMLSHRDKALARSMLSSYLALFQAAVAAKSFDSKTLTAILTGINRALPYVGAADEEGPPAPGKRRGGPPRTAGAADEGAGALETHLDNIFKMVYVASFNTAVQALQVLMQATAVGALAGESGAGGSSTRAASGFGTDVPPVPSTRFYRALYAKLASPDLRVSNKHSLFLNLLFKAVKADPLPARAAAFLKRLLQVAASSPVSFAAGALILVSEVLAARENVWRLLTSPPKPDKPSKPGGGAGGGEKDGEDDSGSDEGASGDPSGSDEEAGGHTVKAGARVTLTGLVGAAHLNGMQGVARELDGDRWVVVVRGEAAPLRVKPQNLRPAQGAGNAAAGGLGAATAAAAAADPALAHLLRYDPMKREPEHAGAAGAQLWELVALQAHFHPTIRHFTAQLLKRARITYPGDPLEDFTAMRFLDKFVYKNPKKRRGKGDGDGSDDEEEARPVSRMAKDKGPGRESEPVVNSVEWMQRSSEALAPEDMFFFRYFSQKDERQSDAKRKAKAKEMDERREREEMEEVEAVTGVEDSGDSGSEGSDGEAAFSASGSEESDVDSSDEEVMDMGGGSGAEVDDDDSDGEDMDMGGGFAAEEEAEASGEEDSEDGYSDMEDISDDEAPVKGKKVASKGDAEQEMMREIEAGIGSDDSDVEFNTRLQAGGGGNWKDEGEDMDNDSDDSSAGGEEAMGGMFHEGDHSDEDGDARGGKKARKGKGAVFASADDYAHLLENDPGSGGESDDQMGGRRGGGRGGGRGRGRGAGNRGRGGAGRGRGR